MHCINSSLFNELHLPINWLYNIVRRRQQLIYFGHFTGHSSLEKTIMQVLNGCRENKPRKAKTKMGEIHHRYVWYDGSGKQSGGGQASISQRHLGSDVLTRICSERERRDYNL